MNTKVKICGIRSVASANAVSQFGGDFIGFNFVPTSKRYILPKDAKNIIKKTGSYIKYVGVFRDQRVEDVDEISQLLNLDFVQLHGNESREYCNRIKREVIKVFSLSSKFNIKEVQNNISVYNTKYSLVDRKVQGEGDMLDLEQVSQLCKKNIIILAGGLNIENISMVIERVHPFAVDVAGGVESEGREDVDKIRQFILSVKNNVK
ncbi:MAG: phosphoribosylanthranilate isomerase [Candidatus Roizmanbacteria bacterium]